VVCAELLAENHREDKGQYTCNKGNFNTMAPWKCSNEQCSVGLEMYWRCLSSTTVESSLTWEEQVCSIAGDADRTSILTFNWLYMCPVTRVCKLLNRGLFSDVYCHLKQTITLIQFLSIFLSSFCFSPHFCCNQSEQGFPAALHKVSCWASH